MPVLRFIFAHIEKGVLVLVVLALLAHVGLSVRKVVVENKAHEELLQQAQGLEEQVKKHKVEVPKRDPAGHSGKVLDEWSKLPSMRPLPVTAFYEEGAGARGPRKQPPRRRSGKRRTPRKRAK